MNELETAAELLENNWCMGSLLNSDGSVCAAGAIYAAHKGYSVGMLDNLNIQEQLAFERYAAEYVNESEAGKAMAAEIIEQGLNEGNVNDDTTPYSVVWYFNDYEMHESGQYLANRKDPKDVIEVMKHAAKRL